MILAYQVSHLWRLEGCQSGIGAAEVVVGKGGAHDAESMRMVDESSIHVRMSKIHPPRGLSFKRQV